MRARRVLVAAAMLAPAVAAACSCFGPEPSAKDAAQRAALVFRGQATRVDKLSSPDRLKVFFERATTAAGETRALELETGNGGGDCGFPFEQGRSYVVYADWWGSRLVTQACSRTRELERAAEDVEYLEQHASLVRQRRRGAGCSSAGGLAPFVLLVLVRRRMPRR